jgi:hypothetical protein
LPFHSPTHWASSLPSSTIAAACAWRTVSAVVAMRAYLGGEDPGRKSSCQFRCGSKGATRTLPHEPGVRRCGLWTRSLYYSLEDARRLWCAHDRRCGGNRHGRTYPWAVLPLAVFPHPSRPLCWIAIRHSFTRMRVPVYRVPCNHWNLKSRLMLGRRVCVLSQKVNHFLVGGALYTFSMTD